MKNTSNIKTLLFGALALGAAMALMPTTARATIFGSPHDFSPTGYPTNTYANQGIATFGHGTSTYQNPCQVCHIPHGAAPYSAANAPLWNHAVAVNANSQYTLYGQGANPSPTFVALGLTMKLGSSVACLSCHDGNIAINQSYSSTATAGIYGSTTYNGNGGAAELITAKTSWAVVTANMGVPATPGYDLSQMHPIGFDYQSAVNARNALDGGATELFADTTLPGYMLQRESSGALDTSDGSVECATCHDIHGELGASATAPDNLVVTIQEGALCLTCHNK